MRAERTGITVRTAPHFRVAIAGGSIGGLFAGVTFCGIGAAFEVFERHAGPSETHGAGFVVQPALADLLRRHSAPPLPTTACRWADR